MAIFPIETIDPDAQAVRVKSVGSAAGDLSTAAKGSTTAGSPTSTNAGTDRQPLDVTLRDTSGNPVSVGGGTQYADGATAATPTGGQINWNEAGTQRAVSATKPLPVDVKTTSIAVTQGTASNLKVDLSGTGANATALKVDGSAVTQPTKETRSTTPSQTSVSVTNANTSVLASNANRLGATIYNEGSATCYLKLGATASTTSYSVQIASGGYYEVPFNYTGAIDAITSASTAQLRITEIA